VFGNLLSAPAPDGTSAAQDSTFDLADHLLTVFPHGSSTKTVFTIDALGRHATRKVGAAPTDTYTYAGASEAVVRIEQSPTVYTDSALDANADRLATKTSGGAFGWLLPDLHGDVAGTLNSGGTAVTDAFRYDPYGKLIGSTTSAVPSPWRYQGRLLETTPGGTEPDLYDFGFRAYSPTLGAFTSLDNVAGSAQNPVSLNRFLYAGANPETMVDPSGHVMLGQGQVCSAMADYCGSPTNSNSVNGQANHNANAANNNNSSNSNSSSSASNCSPFCGTSQIKIKSITAPTAPRELQASASPKDRIADSFGLCQGAFANSNNAGCHKVSIDEYFSDLRAQQANLSHRLTWFVVGVVAGVATVMGCVIGGPAACVVIVMAESALTSKGVPSEYQLAFAAGNTLGGVSASAVGSSALSSVAKLLSRAGGGTSSLFDGMSPLTLDGAGSWGSVVGPTAGFDARELSAAKILADGGHNVVMQPATGTIPTSDYLLGGVRYDHYGPTTSSYENMISNMIASKGPQVRGGGVVLDLRDSPFRGQLSVQRVLADVGRRTKLITDIIIIN
jgi:RHS repeat-associated protein